MAAVFSSPLLRRFGFHLRRLTGDVDRRFFLRLLAGPVGFVLLAATAVTLLGKPKARSPPSPEPAPASRRRWPPSSARPTRATRPTCARSSRHGDRVDRTGRPHRRRGQQPQARRPLRRANADEILGTSRITSRLLARSPLYPGLSELVTDIVSGGQGSELYRVALPADCCGLSLDDVAARLQHD